MFLLLCFMLCSDSDPWDFSLSQDNDFSGSAKLHSRSQCLDQCVFTDCAWHCVSAVNTDNSRKTESYYNFTKLQ